ncbi:MAG: four helix bundle protein [Bacteroidales bacterium]|nr:four helix bundle protein [Bacteroidales bacterium]MCI7614449.1 four helix bundle protein [Bacteroidales bacterium]MDD7233362.1 four helix bundle protein [Bacteroidales bacterium]MDY2706002.1 four helix bundle protein [Alloprevotella sp.]MDY4874101.1 four helix bundle protein [Alloprevotella sp.]
MKDNIIQIKSKAFAIRIIRLYRYLIETKKEYVLSKQLLRSGTSIGANICEALCGVSKKDFLSKMHISFKECVETQYWLDLLAETDYLSKSEYDSISSDCEELRKLLSSITKSTNENIRQNEESKS